MKDNIMRIDYTKTIGQHKFEMIALYNNLKITEKEVSNAIKFGDDDAVHSNSNIIFITKKQFDNIFGE